VERVRNTSLQQAASLCTGVNAAGERRSLTRTARFVDLHMASRLPPLVSLQTAADMEQPLVPARAVRAATNPTQRQSGGRNYNAIGDPIRLHSYWRHAIGCGT